MSTIRAERLFWSTVLTIYASVLASDLYNGRWLGAAMSSIMIAWPIYELVSIRQRGQIRDRQTAAKTLRRLVVTARRDVYADLILSPECDKQQHQACDYRAFNPNINETVQCQCTCHP